MRSLPVIALVLTCTTPVAVAAESPFDPDRQRCARVLPTLAAGELSKERDRAAASADKPLLYKAVEHQINGCAVLIMHQTGEVRHVPEIDPNRSLFVPAR